MASETSGISSRDFPLGGIFHVEIAPANHSSILTARQADAFSGGLDILVDWTRKLAHHRELNFKVDAINETLGFTILPDAALDYVLVRPLKSYLAAATNPSVNEMKQLIFRQPINQGSLKFRIDQVNVLDDDDEVSFEVAFSATRVIRPSLFKIVNEVGEVSYEFNDSWLNTRLEMKFAFGVLKDPSLSAEQSFFIKGLVRRICGAIFKGLKRLTRQNTGFQGINPGLKVDTVLEMDFWRHELLRPMG